MSFMFYTLSNVLVKMAEDRTCRYGKAGRDATDFCLCTSQGFEGKRFLTVKSNSKVKIFQNQSNLRALRQYQIIKNYEKALQTLAQKHNWKAFRWVMGQSGFFHVSKMRGIFTCLFVVHPIQHYFWSSVPPGRNVPVVCKCSSQRKEEINFLRGAAQVWDISIDL